MIKRKILIIAPLNPPYTGNALPVKYIFDEFAQSNTVDLINLSKGTFKSGVFSYNRVVQILHILWQVLQMHKTSDLIYLTIAESRFGNIRDLFIYIFSFFSNRKLFIHMLGGNSMRNILTNKSSIWFWINKFFIYRLAGVIVEGKFQGDFFANVINRERIHIVPNFAQDYLFTDIENIKNKYNKAEPLKVLFLSNLIYGKGHYELVKAFTMLNDTEKDKITINFAGGFGNNTEKETFLSMIAPFPQLKYLGHVGGELKANLFKESHLFCLPTYYPFEGQPFVIVESYAAGCAVFTTNHSGIGQIFKKGLNGVEVQKKSVESLCSALSIAVANPKALIEYALYNFSQASELYTEKAYLDKIKKAFNNVLSN